MITQAVEGEAGIGGRARELLANPGPCALFLDIDGTLLRVVATPDAVHVPAGLAAMLQDLTRVLGGALALLTGRRIADADRLLAPAQPIASGVHGTEMRLSAGGRVEMLAPAIPSYIVEAITALARVFPGVLVEEKAGGVAVHYRGAPQAQPGLQAELETIIAASPQRLVLCKGRKVLEVVPSGYSKGTALESILALPAFKGRRPVMIGDDTGDEPALEAAARLGGVGLRVGGEHFPVESADFAGVDSVHAWLHDLYGRLAASGGPVVDAEKMMG
jgi:trehalose 6-phosphate phosphatase